MGPFEARRGPYLVSTDPRRLDVDAIHAYLTRSYWAQGIPRETVARAVEGSLCFGLYEDRRQIGLARVVTDRSTFAYLCDVYVLEAFRGQGLGTWLAEAVMAHPDLQGLRRFVLLTQDAHGLYERFGFRPSRTPDWYLEIAPPDPYGSRDGTAG